MWVSPKLMILLKVCFYRMQNIYESNGKSKYQHPSILQTSITSGWGYYAVLERTIEQLPVPVVGGRLMLVVEHWCFSLVSLDYYHLLYCFYS